MSQAEVLPPLFSAGPQAILDDEAADDDVIEADNATGVLLPAVGTLDPDAFFSALAAGPTSEIGQPAVRKMRTWASSVGVLVLVGWVLARRK